MNKKTFYFTLTMALLVFIALLSFFSLSNRKNEKDNKISDELGSITVEPKLENATDDYEGDADYNLEVKDYYVGFTNLYVVYDLLTLEAISNLPDDVAEFLNTHGYGDIHTLTVIEDSIVFDKAYPYFICSMEGIDNYFVEVRFDVSKGAFELAIISEEN